MIALRIFTIIAFGGCLFLIYFLVALWRDARNDQPLNKRLPARIGRTKVGNLIRMEGTDIFREKTVSER